MAAIMRAGVSCTLVLFSCVAAQVLLGADNDPVKTIMKKILLGADNDPIETILAKNLSASLPPFIFNGSVVAVNNGTVNVSATERPSGFLTFANATSSSVRVLVSRQGNWTDIPWNTYPVLMENLYNASHHNETDCYTFQVPDAPPGCAFKEEWHDGCAYPRLKCNCSTNEVFSYCGSQCGSNCGDDPKRMLCPAQCNQGCFCAPGHKRNTSGHCVVEKACPGTINCPLYKMVPPPPNCTYALIPQEDGCFIRELQCNDTICSANMTLTDCGSHCSSTCGVNPDETMCSEVCQAGCFCKPNYWFNPLSGLCVAKSDCPARIAPDPTCFYPDLPVAPEGCHYEDKVQFDACPMPTLRCDLTESGNAVCPIAYVSPAPKNCWFERHVDAFGCSYPVVRCPPTCASNEVYKNCSSGCEPTCSQQTPMCSLACMPPKCQCKSGYVRDGTNACILASQCPKVDACLSNPCSQKQKCVNEPKQCLIAPCPQFKCVDENPCGTMSEEPLRDAAGNFLDCDSCRDSNHFCLHQSDKQICCTKPDSDPASTWLSVELAPFQKYNATEGEPLNKLIGGFKATRWNNTIASLASFVIIHAEPALALHDHQLSDDMEAAFVAACRPLTTMGCILKGGIKPLFGPSAGDTQVSINTSDVLLECADGGPLPVGVVSIVFDIDPFFVINRNSCTVVSHDTYITESSNGMHSNATAHEHCDIVPDYGVFGYNAYLRTDSEILAYNPVLYSTPAFEPVRSLTEESFALKLFALREYARSQAQVVSCSPESLQAVTAENVSGDPLEIIYGSFSHSNQSTDHETAGYYEMIANFSDYLSSSPVCGADREYLNIPHRMSCPYRKAMRMFISSKFNEWKEEVDRKRAELLHKEQSSKSSDRFYAKPRPADPPSEPTPPSLITAELCAESALEKFFENDWIGATVPLAWASILSTQQEDASRMKRKPERVPIIDHAADNRDDEGELKSEHHFSLCTNETIADLRQKVAIRSATNVSCGKGDQLPHFLWTKDGFGNIYQGYRLISGEMVWQRRAICSCSAPTCARGQDEKGHTAWAKGHANGNRDDNFVHKLKIEFGTGRDYYDEVSQDDGKAGTRIASAGKIENATAHAASYTDCIATVLKDNGYPGVKLDLPQLAKLAATFDPSLVRTVMGQVNEACGTPPPHVLKQFKLKN